MTQELPPSLAAWRRELSMFPLELAVELGGIVRRLASAIGSPVAARHRGDDPDGYDGIVRNGPYDRMLHSEWLLADELPDEFLRRAIMNEQLFFRIARRSPLDDLMSVALFDAGPSQLGSPRVVHIALLLVLAQRAAERGGTFRWAVLQQHPRVVHEHVDAGAVQSLLDARSAAEVDEASLDHWLDLLPHGDRRHRETWIVGGPRLEALVAAHARSSVAGRDFREASIVSVDEPLDVRERVVFARIRTQVRTQDVTLALPPEDATTRLLRDPFAEWAVRPAKPAVVGAPPPTHFFFAAEGKRIIARPRADGGGVRVYNLSSGGSVKLYEALGAKPVIAAGWGRTRGGTSISVKRWGERRLISGPIHRQNNTIELDPGIDFPWDEELASLDRLRPLVPTSTSSGRNRDHLFLDVRGDCWLTDIPRGRAHRVMSDVRALGHFEGDPYLACHRAGWEIMRIEGDKPRTVARHAGDGPGMFFGMPATSAKELGLLMALQETESRWQVISRSTVHSYACPPGARVIGVTTLHASQPALVLVENRAVSAAAGTSLEVLIRTDHQIVDACFDPSGPQVALVTNGELIVYDIIRKKPVVRFRSRT